LLYPQLHNELNPDRLPESDPPAEPERPDSDEVRDNINDFGQLLLPRISSDIHVITVIGQVEGHLVMPSQNKSTKYEHVIPQLVAVEQCPEVKGMIVILNTVGGDVEAGLAIAEIIASMSKPTVSLVLGGGHSIGVPIAVAARRSFIAPTATMTIHPIRLTGMVVGIQQSFDYMIRMQERIVRFVAGHSGIDQRRFEQMMMATGELAHDVGTIVIGKDAVECGLIDQVGGLSDALDWLRSQFPPEDKAETASSGRGGQDA